MLFLLIGAVTKTSISLFLSASTAALKDCMAYFPLSGVGSPKLTLGVSLQTFTTFILPSIALEASWIPL